MKTAAVILAAGASTRMGTPKPLARLAAGMSFLEALARALRAGGVQGPIHVVTGSHRVAVAAEAHRLRLRPVHNRRHREGQLQSARRGLRAALRGGAQAVLLLPCDLPHLRASTVASVLRAKPPAVASFGGRAGHPLLLDAGAALALLRTHGARTLREALRQARVRPAHVAVTDRAVRENLNDRAQLARWEQRSAKELV